MITNGTIRSSGPVRRICGPLNCSSSCGATHLGAVDLLDQLRDRLTVELGLRVDVEPRDEHERALVRARMWQRQLRIVAAHVVDGHHVHVERARAPSHVARTPGGLLGLVRASEPVTRCGVASSTSTIAFR